MAQLLVSYLLRPPRGDAFGIRIWDDGKVETFASSWRTKNAAGEHVTEPLIPGWHPLTEVGDNALKLIRRAVAEVDFQALPEVIPAEVNGSGTTADWEALTEEGPAKTRVTSWDPLPSAARPLARLIEDLTTIINQPNR